MLAAKRDGLVDKVDHLNIIQIDNKAPSQTDEHVGILQFFDLIFKIMQLERHLPTLPVDEDKVAVVAVGLYVDNFVYCHAYQ